MSSQIAMRVINGIRYRPEDAPRHAAPRTAAYLAMKRLFTP